MRIRKEVTEGFFWMSMTRLKKGGKIHHQFPIISDLYSIQNTSWNEQRKINCYARLFIVIQWIV